MDKTRVVLDPAFIVGEVDRRIFGSFVEHMGRSVHTGIREQAHPAADEHGFRGDVADLAWRSSETDAVGLDDGRAMVGPPEAPR